MKNIDNRQKQHIVARAEKPRRGNKLFWFGQDRSQHVPKEPATGSPAGKEAEAASRGPEPNQPVVRETPKVGRNDPCPCGSGKKFKKCHGA